MWGFRFRHRRRRSLRGRLIRSFVAVTMVALGLALGMTHMGWLRSGPTPAHIRILFPVLVALAGAFGSVTAGMIVRRLSRLEEAVERLDLHDLSRRVPVEGDDEVARLAQAFNRMVDRLAAEEQVRRQLFADMAHELRHPLAVLKGRLDMMQDGVVPLNQEQVLGLQDAVIALTRLVGDVRDLSLAEVDQLSLKMAPVDLTALVTDLVTNMEPVAADRGITLGSELPPTLPAITGDADRLRQVLVNLLANALHYTPGGGQVTVRARAAADQVQLTVSDTGPGIAPEDLPHIFDRFYRTDKARTRSSGGTGLGLAIVRSLVTLHGGTVEAHSTPGQGTCFTVTLPAEARSAADAAAAKLAAR